MQDNSYTVDGEKRITFQIGGAIVCKYFYRIAGGITEQQFNSTIQRVLKDEGFNNVVRVPHRKEPWFTNRKDDRALGALDHIYRCKSLI